MTKKILLADDSITIQKVIGIIFATEDYQLITCDDGDEAFSKALEEYPDLVIADVSMPGKDGFELCEAIKSQAALPNTSVMLLPGTFEHFDEKRAEAVGADGWLSKPFESQALLDKVAQLINAEPVRLDAATATAPAAVAESVEESVTEDVVHDFSSDETAEVESIGGALAGLAGESADAPSEDGSADDIWDAVSFEEDDLQQPGDSAEEVSEPAGELPEPAGELPEPAGELPEPAEEEPFSFGGQGDESLELSEETSTEEVEALDLEDIEEDEPLELTEEDADAFGEEPVAELEPLVEGPLPVVEPLAEESVEDEEEVLDLAEDDILNEELPEEEVLDLVDEVDGEPGAEALEEVVEFEPEEIGEFSAEVSTVTETEEDPLESAEAVAEMAVEPDDSLVAPAASIAVSEPQEPVDGVSVEQVEQQLRELSDDELKEVVARVAGPTVEKLANEMLEKIVWEVVPDLAESMIREEIRKIRQGADD